jgi:signal peptidase I
MKKLFVLFFLAFTLLIGCSDKEISKITDDETKDTVEIVHSDGYKVFSHLYDNMDRGKHEYHGEVVVDEKAFNEGDPKRGDIVYYQTPEFKYDKYPNLKPSEFEISRIVGLPGETIEIKEGQVYINGALLDAFYGREYQTGKIVEDSEVELKKTKIPDDHYLVLGDNWWRSIDGVIFGPLERNLIKGKVLGVNE